MDYKTAVASYAKSPFEGDLRIAGDRCFILFLIEKLLSDIKIALIAPTFALNHIWNWLLLPILIANGFFQTLHLLVDSSPETEYKFFILLK